jgi:hypothetical protein
MWGKKKIAGTVYDLTHLEPFILRVGTVRLRVEFSCHCFTEEYNGTFHTPDLAISDGTDLRAFCLIRYGHSLRLPAAVAAATGSTAYLSDGRMHICAGLPGLQGPYLIAYKIRRARARDADGVIHITTAHHRPDADLTLPSAPFNATVFAMITGGKISWKKK